MVKVILWLVYLLNPL